MTVSEAGYVLAHRYDVPAEEVREASMVLAHEGFEDTGKGE